ncbi:hypothetical protein HanRHA438_Chr06g0264111 [Helianthus annuus]|uniref:Uncharacterized protein n=1 Tax=Helianthus annuus TaxID=4232 RepID=A0A9K3NIQ3_HELAN|nr:hypothetical protein HanXRQr2_Chr06g0254731 [Helianthus annuus]KAJ0911523.1 hypothetical protein HanRHA438_Chr06g0264111 [Helianthus annuus]KAJ0915081.1 hypothetical protein HanPSC8_Chr06g0245881 [Helianthus annuus]
MKNKRDQYCQAAKLVCWARIARGTRAFGPPGHVQRQICIFLLFYLLFYVSLITTHKSKPFDQYHGHVS